MTLQDMRSQFAANETEYSGILAQGDAVSAEDLARAEELIGSNETLRQQIEATPSASALSARAEQLVKFGSTSSGNVTHLAPPSGNQPRTFSVPATVRQTRVLNFQDREGSPAAARAYAFGQWVLSTLNRPSSRAWCREHGLELVTVDGADRVTNLGHNEIVNTSGGFLVPSPLENDLIDLREKFGVARQLCRNRSMTADTLSIPRRTSGLTAYWVQDEDAITESTKGWDRVNLVAKKIGVLAKISSELNEDAIIDVGDDLAREIAYAFAGMEDDCLFNGDGSSTYGGIQGCRDKLTSIDGAGTDSAGLLVATGNTSWGALTLTNFNNTKALLPEYAVNGGGRVVWVCSQQFWAAAMERVALAAGGITDAMIAAGTQRRFLGYDVVIAQKMPTATASGQVCALLGNFSLGVAFGDRRMTTLLASEHAYFANDQIGIRGTERFDINVHDIGTSTVPGPIVGIQTA